MLDVSRCLSVLRLSACASAHQNAAAKSSDEVSFGCWESNADVKAWMAKNAMGTNLTLLNNYYMSNLLKIIKGTMNKTAMFWRPGAADSLPQTEVPAGEPPRTLPALGCILLHPRHNIVAGRHCLRCLRRGHEGSGGGGLRLDDQPDHGKCGSSH